MSGRSIHVICIEGALAIDFCSVTSFVTAI